MQETWLQHRRLGLILCQKIPGGWATSSQFHVFLRILWTEESWWTYTVYGVTESWTWLTATEHIQFFFLLSQLKALFSRRSIIRNFLFNLLEVIFTLVAVVYLHGLFFLQMATYYTVPDLAFSLRNILWRFSSSFTQQLMNTNFVLVIVLNALHDFFNPQKIHEYCHWFAEETEAEKLITCPKWLCRYLTEPGFQIQAVWLKWPHTVVLRCISEFAFSVERAIWFLHMHDVPVY